MHFDLHTVNNANNSLHIRQLSFIQGPEF